MAFTWAAKDPNEVLDYTHNWDARLAADTIQGAPQAIVDSGDVVMDATSMLAGGRIQKVRLSGGTNGQACKLTLRVTGASGQIYDEGIKLKIKTR